MSKETSSTIFKKLVNSPVGIIAEFIVNKLATEYGYEPLRNYFLEIQTGKTPPMSNPEYYASNDIEWIKPSDIGFEKYISASDWISNKAIKENKATIYKPNTVLIICIGGGIGRLGIVDKICSSNQQITGILFKNEVSAEFVYYFFLSRYKIFEENSSKSTLPIINQKGLGNLDFTCPENLVQKEVVRYLDYCKKCLDEFIYPSNSNFELNSEILDFADKAFKAFYTQRSLLAEYSFQLIQLENLNQAILQEAVQGKLVKQDPKDLPDRQAGEPASELLKRIASAKLSTGKAAKMNRVGLKPNSKKKTNVPALKGEANIKPEEIPFEIPENWVWCRLDDILDFRKESLRRGPFGSSITKSMFIPKTSPNATKIFEQKNAIYKDYTLGNYYIDIEKHPNLKSFFASGGDIIISCAGTIGEAYLLPNESPIGIINQALLKIRLNDDVILNSYFLDFFKAIIKSKVNSDAKGSAMKNLGSIKYLRESLLIPLPPLSEQKRIVAEIEKQLAKTKQLKEHIIANQQATEQLLKALLHQAFEVREMEEVTN